LAAPYRFRQAKLTSGVNFINILRAGFFVQKKIEQLFSSYIQLCIFLVQKYWNKRRALNVDEIGFWWFGFRLKPIYTTALAASENDACFKRTHNQLKNNHLYSLI